jgi:hypothetical protein
MSRRAAVPGSVPFLLLLLAFADISVSHLAANGCGLPQWRALGRAIDAYCRERAAPSERLGCRIAQYSFDHCEASPQLHAAADGSLTGDIRDPRDSSYAWLLTFARRRHAWTLTRFEYRFDDCDAMGIPPPPRGPIHLADLRRSPSN